MYFLQSCDAVPIPCSDDQTGGLPYIPSRWYGELVSIFTRIRTMPASSPLFGSSWPICLCFSVRPLIDYSGRSNACAPLASRAQNVSWVKVACLDVGFQHSLGKHSLGFGPISLSQSSQRYIAIAISERFNAFCSSSRSQASNIAITCRARGLMFRRLCPAQVLMFK